MYRWDFKWGNISFERKSLGGKHASTMNLHRVGRILNKWSSSQLYWVSEMLGPIIETSYELDIILYVQEVCASSSRLLLLLAIIFSVHIHMLNN